MTQPAVVQSAEAISQMATARIQREIFYFTIPEPIAGLTKVNEIGLVELSSGEELMATKRSGGNGAQMAIELAKESLREVNGAQLSSADGSTDAFWARQGRGTSRLRQLVLAAYSRIHNPRSDETIAFLGSERVVVR